MQVWKINQYLSLRFENNHTTIYVGGSPITQCKYLLMNISKKKIRDYDKFENIDQIKEYYSNQHEHSKRVISPKEAFVGHCSNLEAWAEHNYNTNLLDSKLSFPLLYELSKAGDPKAKRVFKEELVRRFIKGRWGVCEFLYRRGYLRQLDNTERELLVRKTLNLEKSKKKLRKTLILYKATDGYLHNKIRENIELFLKEDYVFPIMKRLLSMEQIISLSSRMKEIVKNNISNGTIDLHRKLLTDLLIRSFTVGELKELYERIDGCHQKILRAINSAINQKEIIENLREKDILKILKQKNITSISKFKHMKNETIMKIVGCKRKEVQKYKKRANEYKGVLDNIELLFNR